MMEQVREVWRPRARMTGALYLLYFLTTILGMLLVSRGFAVSGNAINDFSTVCYLVVTFLFYVLFKPVSGSLSMLAALFSLGGCVDMSLGLLHLDSSVNPLLFFGPFCLLIGYLIFRSSFLPRILGVLMAVAGLGWAIRKLPLSKWLNCLQRVADESGYLQPPNLHPAPNRAPPNLPIPVFALDGRNPS
jgi:hypothetical protein